MLRKGLQTFQITVVLTWYQALVPGTLDSYTWPTRDLLVRRQP